MIIKSHTNKVHPKSESSLDPNKAHNIYTVNPTSSTHLNNLNKKSDLVRLAYLVSLDFIALILFFTTFYFLLVGSCILSDECFNTFYGV